MKLLNNARIVVLNMCELLHVEMRHEVELDWRVRRKTSRDESDAHLYERELASVLRQARETLIMTKN